LKISKLIWGILRPTNFAASGCGPAGPALGTALLINKALQNWKISVRAY